LASNTPLASNSHKWYDRDCANARAGGCRGGAAPPELSYIRMPLFIAKTRLPSQKWLNRSSGVQRECSP